MRRARAVLVTALWAAPAAAEVTVRVLPAAPGATPSVELTARSAPLSEVLDRLARQIGMKVVYEGASPRQLVTVSLSGRSPAETVLGLLEGTGVNYALLSDPTGSRVETLLVAGSAPQAASSASGSAAVGSSGRAVPQAFRRPGVPPGAGPDSFEEEPEDLEEEGVEEPLEAPEGPAAAAVQAADPNAAGQTAPPPPPQPFAPTSAFPVSPFAPQAAPPYTPQPFPPLPPGVPGGPTAAPQQQQQQDTTGQPPPE